ncbi:hypothetical protein LCI18_006879 [Fusarium solani-melongenae]|uniref:Uncharacterized protein n=1 Tax=Fusarium solani subsp. cucurbitae TaxID=2747967 RepID=A0ACD3Z3V2_FUSSC|nr:hypothetical protein LCI18_006879 [Fusarium solani-melongenae]
MPDPDPEPPQLQRFRELKNLVFQYEEAFKRLQPPDATFEKRSGEIEARLKEAWAQLSTANPEDQPKCQEKIAELIESRTEIKLGHKRQKELYEVRLRRLYSGLRDRVSKVMVERPEETPTTAMSKDGDPVIRKPLNKIFLSSQPSLSSPAKPSSSSHTPPTASRKRRDPSSSLLTPEQKRLKLEKTPRKDPRGSHADQQDYQGITDPEPGQVYLAFWESSKQWVPVLLLPMTDLEQVGVSGSLDSLGLAEILPICYDQDTLTGERTWRDGYKNGQALVTEREFPAMYFEGRVFPDKSPVGWVAAKDLRKFDVATGTSHLVPQIQMVRKFLEERAPEASCNGAEKETSCEKDISSCGTFASFVNQDEQPGQVSPTPETAQASEASTNGRQPASGPTPESQPAPHTPASGEKPRPDTTTEAAPKERLTGDAQSKSMEAQSVPRQSTPLRPCHLVMADLTPSTNDPTSVSESELSPQDTITVMELGQTSTDNAQPAPEAVMALEEQASAGSSPGRTFKAEPYLNIPRNINIQRDIEITSIMSTKPEEEEDGDGETVVPEFTNATLGFDDFLGPAKHPGAVGEGRAEEGRPPHHDESQSDAQAQSLPGQASFDSLKAYEQAQKTPQSCRPTGSTPQTASDRAADPDQPRQDGAWRESESWPLPTSMRRSTVVRDTTGRNMHALLVSHGLFDLARHYENPSLDPLGDSPICASPKDNTPRPPGAELQPVAETPSVGRDRGSIHIRPDTHDPSISRSSSPSIHFTPLAFSVLPPSTTVAPSGTATSLPPTFARTSAPSSEAHHDDSTNLSNSDQHLSNYGIKRVPAPTGAQAAKIPRLQTTASQGQSTPQRIMRGTNWHPSFPPGLITYLEDVLRRNGAPVIGMDSLMNSHGKYICLLCKPAERKAYVRTDNFASHIIRHWETHEGNRPS